MTFREILATLEIPCREQGHEHCRTGWIQLDCPDCSPNSEHWRLGYNIYGNYMNCWSCGRRNVADVLCQLSGKPYPAVKDVLGNLIQDRVIVEELARPEKVVLPPGLGELEEPHRTYLRRRGFKPDEIVKLWGVKGLGLVPRLPWRIWIPIHHETRVVSWTTRSIGNGPLCRYRSAGLLDEIMAHKGILYGADYCRNAIIIVEGPLDAWAIGPGAGATLGTAYSRAQLETMARYPVRAVCFDNLPDAQTRARRLVNDLSVMPGETFNVQLDAKDPAEADKREIRLLRRTVLGV